MLRLEIQKPRLPNEMLTVVMQCIKFAQGHTPRPCILHDFGLPVPRLQEAKAFFAHKQHVTAACEAIARHILAHPAPEKGHASLLWACLQRMLHIDTGEGSGFDIKLVRQLSVMHLWVV